MKVELVTHSPYRTCPIDQILVGSRHRRDLGDIDTLARSIAEIGLLHPITVDTNSTLIAGSRRLEACRRLDWAEIPVIVLDTKLGKGEHR